MKFTELELCGAYLIELEDFKDERGTFARQFCKNELSKFGIDFNICQCNISKNYKKNTIRGMHYQKEPFLEPKLGIKWNDFGFEPIMNERDKNYELL